MDRIEISPASLAQVRMTARGQRLRVTQDVQNVATDLATIDASLKLAFDPYADCFIVYQDVYGPDGEVMSEHLVTTAQDCDQRLVNRVREISQPGYDLGREIEKVEAQVERAKEHDRRERTGEAHEALAFALRKDLSRHEHPNTLKSRVYVPDKAA